ncbi:MAG: GrpB family protein [Acidobacteriaceae bacterium]|nr:GrpB family protein [Acidobacteriaceae bacterium]
MSHPVRQELQIVSYNPRWVVEFEAEQERIVQALGKLALRIDHNGSTAVPGLDAKPIIDIQLSVKTLQPIEAYAGPLATLGCVHKPHPNDAVCPFFHRPTIWPHRYHIHVVQFGGEEERRTLAFRDFLREHGEVARKYAILKKHLAATIDAADASAREAYATAKTEFVERVVQTALAAGYPQDQL